MSKGRESLYGTAFARVSQYRSVKETPVITIIAMKLCTNITGKSIERVVSVNLKLSSGLLLFHYLIPVDYCE